MVTHHISNEYAQRLTHDYGPHLAHAIDDEWRTAELGQQPGQQIEYIRLGEQTAAPGEKPVLFIYGYTAGIIANAPFGAAMASRGFDIIIPNQNRYGLLKNPQGKHDATYNQALNMAAILEAEQLQDTPLNVVTHSHGSLIFDELSRHAKHSGWHCFEDSKVAMLAPAGVKQQEHVGSFMKRYIALMRAGNHMEKFPDSYWEFGKEMFAAGQQYFMTNKARSLREGAEIIHRRVNFSGLLNRQVGEIALVPFAEDKLFSQDELAASIGAVVNSQIVSFSPVSMELDAKGLRSGRGADHSDQQFNPERVAGAIAQFLRH